MNPESLWLLCALLFADGATFAFATTPLLLEYGKFHPAWQVALAGSVASAGGSMLQLLALRWVMASGRPWMRRLAPSRERLETVMRANPSVSFLAILVARATPLPDAPLKLVAAAGGYPVPRYGLAIVLGALPYYFLLRWTRGAASGRAAAERDRPSAYLPAVPENPGYAAFSIFLGRSRILRSPRSNRSRA
ncbi:MAG: hypothetical protein HZB25_11620 [Candidatus Eisenbacteria bacterium]|nr:hypothetical protein [Candidatus Eisenbacteria bacterium]